MEAEKSEVLRECKNLLRLINCEAVIDTKDETLYDILFKSHTKKKMLLSWLIQQLYSAECCASNSFEDLLTLFISKQHLQNFLTGKMPMLDQYKYWKLIMRVLHQRQKRKGFSSVSDVNKQIESGSLLEKYESMWNEKLGSSFNYVGLVLAKETTLKVEELRSSLESIKIDKINYSSLLPEQLSLANDRVFHSDSHSRHVETLRNSDEKLNSIICENLKSLEPNALIYQINVAPKYEQFDLSVLNDTKNKLQTLNENIEIFSELVHGVDNLQF